MMEHIKERLVMICEQYRNYTAETWPHHSAPSLIDNKRLCYDGRKTCTLQETIGRVTYCKYNPYRDPPAE